MNVYAGIHSYYFGIDLHTRTMYVCILDSDGHYRVLYAQMRENH